MVGTCKRVVKNRYIDICGTPNDHALDEWEFIELGQKKKIDVLPSSGITEYLGRSVRNFFKTFFFKKPPKVPNLGALFFNFSKKHPIC